MPLQKKESENTMPYHPFYSLGKFLKKLLVSYWCLLEMLFSCTVLYMLQERLHLIPITFFLLSCSIGVNANKIQNFSSYWNGYKEEKLIK